MGASQRIHTSDPELRKVQENLGAELDELRVSPLASVALLTSQAISSSAFTEVAHGLGRTLRGWIPVRVRADVRLWDGQDTNPRPEMTLRLRASAAVTVDLLVF